MKKLLVLLCGGVLVGFGCREVPQETVPKAADGTALKPTETVEGEWFLTFDLPEGWVMAPSYNETDTGPVTETPITNQMSDVVLQSTNAVIDLDGENVAEGAVTEGYAYTHIYRMDKRTALPEDAEDIGNGFYRLQKGVTLTYYFVGDLAHYKFVVYWNGVDRQLIEDTLKSAQEVTAFGADDSAE